MASYDTDEHPKTRNKVNEKKRMVLIVAFCSAVRNNK